MFRFAKFPYWIINIFSLLCLFQVKTWFEEIIESFHAATNSFIFMGQRFSILPNVSFIVDESLKMYGLNYDYALN